MLRKAPAPSMDEVTFPVGRFDRADGGLVERLNPGGAMLLGLYSDAARIGSTAARDAVRRAGCEPTPQGIHRARALIRELPPGAPGAEVSTLTIGSHQ